MLSSFSYLNIMAAHHYCFDRQVLCLHMSASITWWQSAKVYSCVQLVSKVLKFQNPSQEPPPHAFFGLYIFVAFYLVLENVWHASPSHWHIFSPHGQTNATYWSSSLHRYNQFCWAIFHSSIVHPPCFFTILKSFDIILLNITSYITKEHQNFSHYTQYSLKHANLFNNFIVCNIFMTCEVFSFSFSNDLELCVSFCQ